MVKNLLCFSTSGSGKWLAPSQVLNCKVLWAILGTLRQLILRATWNFLMERSVPCYSYTLRHVFLYTSQEGLEIYQTKLGVYSHVSGSMRLYTGTTMLTSANVLAITMLSANYVTFLPDNSAAKSCDHQNYHDSSCGAHEAYFAVESVSERNNCYWLLS